MKRLLIALVAVVAVLALVMPASAAELKFGGYYDTKLYHANNQRDADDDADDQLDGIKTRMRLYFTAIGSENLRAVVRTEFDDVWGNARLGKQGADGGSRDNSGFEIKQGYIDFNLPDTPLNVKVGIIPAKVGKSGIVYNDDTSGVALGANFDPVKVSLVYSRLNDNSQTGFPWTDVTTSTATDQDDDVDLWAFDVKYGQEMFDLAFSAAWVNTESRPSADQVPDCAIDNDPTSPTFGTIVCPPATGTNDHDEDVNYFIFAVDFDLSLDIFNFYLTAAQNAGEDKGADAGDGADYKGYLVTLGGTAAVTDMVTAGVDLYWASGDDDPDDGDIDSFETLGGIGRPTYNMDEVVFPGWFDDETATAATFPGGGAFANNPTSTGGFSSGGFVPNNIIAIGAHADLKPLDQTLIQVGGAWMTPAEDIDADGDGDADDDDPYGTSVYVRLQQGIVDGLKLKAAIGYLFADDGYGTTENDDDAYRMGLGLYWSW
jgi:hypothetical protein